MFELLVLVTSLLANAAFLVYHFYPDTKASATIAADATAFDKTVSTYVGKVEAAVDSHVQSLPTTTTV